MSSSTPRTTETTVPAVTAATPVPSTTVSRTQMSSVAAQLVASRFITENRNDREMMYHLQPLEVAVMYQMFCNILRPLVRKLHRELGAQTLTNNNDVILINRFIDFIAYDCLLAMYTVLYNKANAYLADIEEIIGPTPAYTSRKFPSYVTALINSIGPVQTGPAVPFRGKQVPFLEHDEVIATRPLDYDPAYYDLYMERVEKSKTIAYSAFDPHAKESSAWWTFHPVKAGADITGSPALWSLYSPYGFDVVDNALKLGTLFAGERLTQRLGAVSHSVSEWYETPNDPSIHDFPLEVFNEPFHIIGHPAWYPVFKRHEDSPPTASTSKPRNPYIRETKKQKTALGKRKATTDVVPVAPMDVDKKIMHRIIFLYFDHIVCERVTNDEFARLSLSLNSV